MSSICSPPVVWYEIVFSGNTLQPYILSCWKLIFLLLGLFAMNKESLSPDMLFENLAWFHKSWFIQLYIRFILWKMNQGYMHVNFVDFDWLRKSERVLCLQYIFFTHSGVINLLKIHLLSYHCNSNLSASPFCLPIWS